MEVRNELPAPFALQAVTLKDSITLSWQWPRPESLPVFSQFRYEVKRSDGKHFLVSDATFRDDRSAPGTYTYVVRVFAMAKQRGKQIAYVSDWSESASGTLTLQCARPPTVEMNVEPTQKNYSSIPSLRFHLRGQASIEPGCTLTSVNYHLDTGTGVNHGGPLQPDSRGRFDAFVDAFGPEDEIPSGRVSFSLTATAQNEAGQSTSNVYTVDVELRNKFAPH